MSRITSLIAEELPLHHLIPDELTPVLTAELQNVTCSPTVAKLTCALAHFLVFLLFRQSRTQRSGCRDLRSRVQGEDAPADATALGDPQTAALCDTFPESGNTGVSGTGRRDHHAPEEVTQNRQTGTEVGGSFECQNHQTLSGARRSLSSSSLAQTQVT
ncbi:UNVERIFIED_CONTAM: hypothetical protein HHA_307630 [Hammondia hammondi]|eukprot:XP_008888861.1 hypothetical protein HHA_307630 [Hammondia hammondi]